MSETVRISELMAASGVAFAFEMPARQAFIVELVGREISAERAADLYGLDRPTAGRCGMWTMFPPTGTS